MSARIAILFYGHLLDHQVANLCDWEGRYVEAKGCVRPSSDSKPYSDRRREILRAAPCDATAWHPYIAVKASMRQIGDPREAGDAYALGVTALDADPRWDETIAQFCRAIEVDVGDRRPGWWLALDWRQDDEDGEDGEDGEDSENDDEGARRSSPAVDGAPRDPAARRLGRGEEADPMSQIEASREATPETTAVPEPTCPGNVQIWDQTVGCPECRDDLWSYPGIDDLGLSVEAYEARFWRRHPFGFMDCHDDGDEDAAAWEEEIPIGGWAAAYSRGAFGNAIERHVR